MEGGTNGEIVIEPATAINGKRPSHSPLSQWQWHTPPLRRRLLMGRVSLLLPPQAETHFEKSDHPSRQPRSEADEARPVQEPLFPAPLTYTKNHRSSTSPNESRLPDISPLSSPPPFSVPLVRHTFNCWSSALSFFRANGREAHFGVHHKRRMDRWGKKEAPSS